MTDFQVGDRVSVEGVIGRIDREHGYTTCLVRAGSKSVFYDPSDITLIERPKRKLRVGSVWERISPTIGKEYDRYVWTGLTFVSPHGDRYDRETRDFDTHPELWHEVPVEELEREAADE